MTAIENPAELSRAAKKICANIHILFNRIKNPYPNLHGLYVHPARFHLICIQIHVIKTQFRIPQRFHKHFIRYSSLQHFKT